MVHQEIQILRAKTADNMSENVIGVFGLPYSIATNFQINQRDYIVPMVVEEPSIVAGVSGAAKIIRKAGGFKASILESLLIGQIQLLGVKDIDQAISVIENAELNKHLKNIVIEMAIIYSMSCLEWLLLCTALFFQIIRRQNNPFYQ